MLDGNDLAEWATAVAEVRKAHAASVTEADRANLRDKAGVDIDKFRLFKVPMPEWSMVYSRDRFSEMPLVYCGDGTAIILEEAAPAPQDAS
jgi:hypothetical protein